MIDEYIEWNPINDLPNEFYLYHLSDGYNGMSIFLKDLQSRDDTLFKIVFSNFLAYRVVQESGRLKTLDNLTFGTFNLSTKSEFLTWFKDEGQGIYDEQDINHYSICCSDKIVDIISVLPPSVKWEKSPF